MPSDGGRPSPWHRGRHGGPPRSQPGWFWCGEGERWHGSAARRESNGRRTPGQLSHHRLVLSLSVRGFCGRQRGQFWPQPRAEGSRSGATAAAPVGAASRLLGAALGTARRLTLVCRSPTHFSGCPAGGQLSPSHSSGFNLPPPPCLTQDPRAPGNLQLIHLVAAGRKGPKLLQHLLIHVSSHLQRCRRVSERQFGNLLLLTATGAPSCPLQEFAAPPATAGFLPQQKVAPSTPRPPISSSPCLIKTFLPAAPSLLLISMSTNGLLCESNAHSAELGRLETLIFSCIYRKASFILNRSGSF